MKTALTGRLSAAALLRFMSKTAPAPSDIWDEVPAVVVPSFWKAGFSLLKRSIDVPLRGHSS